MRFERYFLLAALIACGLFAWLWPAPDRGTPQTSAGRPHASRSAVARPPRARCGPLDLNVDGVALGTAATAPSDLHRRLHLEGTYVELTMAGDSGWVSRVDGTRLYDGSKEIVTPGEPADVIRRRFGDAAQNERVFEYEVQLRNALPDGRHTARLMIGEIGESAFGVSLRAFEE